MGSIFLVTNLINARGSIKALIPDAIIDVLFTDGSRESCQTITRVPCAVTSPQTHGTIHTGIRRIALRSLYYLTCSPDEP